MKSYENCIRGQSYTKCTRSLVCDNWHNSCDRNTIIQLSLGEVLTKFYRYLNSPRLSGHSTSNKSYISKLSFSITIPNS